MTGRSSDKDVPYYRAPHPRRPKFSLEIIWLKIGPLWFLPIRQLSASRLSGEYLRLFSSDRKQPGTETERSHSITHRNPLLLLRGRQHARRTLAPCCTSPSGEEPMRGSAVTTTDDHSPPCHAKDCMELYFHFPIRLHSAIVNQRKVFTVF
jgi:hypothetical protein